MRLNCKLLVKKLEEKYKVDFFQDEEVYFTFGFNCVESSIQFQVSADYVHVQNLKNEICDIHPSIFKNHKELLEVIYDNIEPRKKKIEYLLNEKK